MQSSLLVVAFLALVALSQQSGTKVGEKPVIVGHVETAAKSEKLKSVAKLSEDKQQAEEYVKKSQNVSQIIKQLADGSLTTDDTEHAKIVSVKQIKPTDKPDGAKQEQTQPKFQWINEDNIPKEIADQLEKDESIPKKVVNGKRFFFLPFLLLLLLPFMCGGMGCGPCGFGGGCGPYGGGFQGGCGPCGGGFQGGFQGGCGPCGGGY